MYLHSIGTMIHNDIKISIYICGEISKLERKKYVLRDEGKSKEDVRKF